MKKKLNQDFMEDLKELSIDETVAITGGSDIWYWVTATTGFITGILTGVTR